MKRILFACLMSLCAMSAYALEISVPVGSYHFDRTKQWNEDNAGLGVVYKDYVAGYYRNSYDKDTFYAGYHWKPISLGTQVKLGVTGGLVTGYDSPIMIVPTLSIEAEPFAADIIFAPALGKATAFVGMSLRFAFPD